MRAARPIQVHPFGTLKDYFSDVLRDRSLRPSNPILDDLKGLEIPSFALWRPHHLAAAAKEYSGRHNLAVEKFQESLHTTVTLLDKATADEALSLLSDTVSEWDKLLPPYQELQRSASMFCVLSKLSTRKKWEESFVELRSTLPPPDTNRELIGLLRTTLEKILEKIDTSAHGDESVWAARHLTHNILHKTGLGLPAAEQEEYDQNLVSIKTVDGRILQTGSPPGPKESRQFLSDAYSVLELRRRNADILGYSSFANMVMQNRMAKEAELRNLHEAVAGYFLPVLESIHNDPFDLEVLRKNGLVSPTLDGCLLAISKVFSEMIGVDIREDKNGVEAGAVWHSDARLFHLLDFKKTNHEGEPFRLGSIVVDPFRRPGKMKRSFVIPIRHRGDKSPLAAMALDIMPPTWDDQSPEISWDNAEDLFHEWGHAIQILLSQSSIGGICGAQNLKLEISEMMPKVGSREMHHYSLGHTLFSHNCIQFSIFWQSLLSKFKILHP